MDIYNVLRETNAVIQGINTRLILYDNAKTLEVRARKGGYKRVLYAGRDEDAAVRAFLTNEEE